MGNKAQLFESLVSKIKSFCCKESNLLWEGSTGKIKTGAGKLISPTTGATIANIEKGFIKLQARKGEQIVDEGINRYRTYIPAEGSPLYGLVKSTTTYNSPQIGKGFEAVVEQNGKQVTINNHDTFRTYLQLNRMTV